MQPPRPLGPRVIVTGRPGSGKTRLARELASRYRCELIRLDPLITDQITWRKKPPERISPTLNAVARHDEWVLEGMGQDIPEHAWKRATTVIWLDYPRALLIWRLFKRARKIPKLLARLHTWGGIRYTLMGHTAERARLERCVRDNTPRHAELIRVSRIKHHRELIARLAEGESGMSRRHGEPPSQRTAGDPRSERT